MTFRTTLYQVTAPPAHTSQWQDPQSLSLQFSPWGQVILSSCLLWSPSLEWKLRGVQSCLVLPWVLGLRLPWCRAMSDVIRRMWLKGKVRPADSRLPRGMLAWCQLPDIPLGQSVGPSHFSCERLNPALRPTNSFLLLYACRSDGRHPSPPSCTSEAPDVFWTPLHLNSSFLSHGS